jgi:hypothetical protein
MVHNFSHSFPTISGFLVTMYWDNGKWELLINPEIMIYFIGQQQTYKKRGLRALSASYSGKNRSEDICKMLYDQNIIRDEDSSILKLINMCSFF